MTDRLTLEQLQLLQNAFDNLPKGVSHELYGSMEGVKKQIDLGLDVVTYMVSNPSGGIDLVQMEVPKQTIDWI